MSRIRVHAAEQPERVLPTFARHTETGDFYIIHNTHGGKDAITWAVNLNANGERIRYDHNIEGTFELLEVGTILEITV